MGEKIEIYTARVDRNGEWYVDGPGDGLNYHSGVLWPDLRCKSEEEAIRGAKIANVAYGEGMEDMCYKLRKLIGARKD